MKRFKQTPKTYSEMNVCDNGEWVRFTDAEAEIADAYQAGTDMGRKEDRECIVAFFQGWSDKAERDGAYADAGSVRLCLKHFLGAAEPRCTCNDGMREGIERVNHLPSCPCYNPPEPRCTCVEPIGGGKHSHTCPCYDPPELCPDYCEPSHVKGEPCPCPCHKSPERKPLEKLHSPIDFSTTLGLSLSGAAKINAIIDSVNDIVRRMNEISPGNRP